MKLFFAPLLEPLGALGLLMALGVLWLLRGKHWRAAAWLGGPTLIVWGLGSTPLVDWLVEREEARYLTKPALTGMADAVVALGGGQTVSRGDLLGFSVSEAGDRVLTAVDLVRMGKARTLVLGGSWEVPGEPGTPAMTVVRNWVTHWRLVDGPVPMLGLCGNTHDEAVRFRQLQAEQGWHKVILVTSALHLPRSEATFRRAGVEVVPFAADFQVAGVPRNPQDFSVFPRQHRFELLSLYFHEWIGWQVYRWRGWI